MQGHLVDRDNTDLDVAAVTAAMRMPGFRYRSFAIPLPQPPRQGAAETLPEPAPLEPAPLEASAGPAPAAELPGDPMPAPDAAAGQEPPAAPWTTQTPASAGGALASHRPRATSSLLESLRRGAAPGFAPRPAPAAQVTALPSRPRALRALPPSPLLAAVAAARGAPPPRLALPPPGGTTLERLRAAEGGAALPPLLAAARDGAGEA
jgi:hypothetical protein